MAADIVLKDRNGNDVTYEGIETVTFDTPTEGAQATFTLGTEQTGKEVELALANGDQVVEADEGHLLREVTIKKPVDLLAENIRKGKSIGGVQGDFVGDTEEATVDLNFVGTSTVEVLAEQTFTSTLDAVYGYMYNPEGQYALTVGETYTVTYDGSEYTCVAMDGSAVMDGAVFVGNAVAFGLSGNGEPFAVGVVGGGLLIACLTDTEPASHTAAVYQVAEGIADMVITPTEDGKVLSKVTITKPETLVPENIAKDVEIGGVVGTHEGGGGDYTVLVLDYDGTVLAEKHLNEGNVFTLPAAPAHEGLVFDGWSSSADIVDNSITVGQQDVMVGAMYHTASGATEVDIVLTSVTGLTCTFVATLTGKTSIDWGDGTTDTKTTHTYSTYGKYTIKIYGMTALGNGSTSTGGLVTKQTYYVTSVRFASTVNTIGKYAFVYCYGLRSVVIPNSVTTIDAYTFYYCQGISCVVIPNSVTRIASNTFDHVGGLKEVVIPKGVTDIGSSAFYYCYRLPHIVIPDGVTTIGGSAFYECHNLESITVPGSVTSFGSTFRYIYGLRKVVILEGATTISSSAFQCCYGLTDVVIPNSVTSIGSGAFYSCYGLTDVVIPEGVTSLEGSVFGSCYGLRSVVVPKSVATVAAGAFGGSYGVVRYDFTAHTSVPTLSAATAFTGINGACQILVPAALYDEWVAATNWATYADYIVAV